MIHLLKGGTLALLPAPKIRCRLRPGRDQADRRPAGCSLSAMPSPFRSPTGWMRAAMVRPCWRACGRLPRRARGCSRPRLKQRLIAHHPSLMIIRCAGIIPKSSGTGIGHHHRSRLQPAGASSSRFRDARRNCSDENLKRKSRPAAMAWALSARTGPLPPGLSRRGGEEPPDLPRNRRPALADDR